MSQRTNNIWKIHNKKIGNTIKLNKTDEQKSKRQSCYHEQKS